MNNRLRFIVTTFLIIVIFGAGLSTGIIFDRQVSNVSAAPLSTASSNAPDFNLIKDAWNTINKVYVDRSALDSTKLTYGAISGMVSALGDTGHSTFLTPQMVKDEQNFTQGSFEGIGALMEMKNGQPTIVTPFDGSPAQKAGLRPGDILVKVNGNDVSGLPLSQVVSQVLGPAGTQVTLTIMDPKTGVTRDVTITRAKIVVNNVTWIMLPGTHIAQIRVAAFSQNVTQDLKQAIQDAQQQGATGIVLDLRNDPGGLLNEAVGVASQFLSSGNVMLEQNAQGQRQPLAVEKGGIAPKIPMVVLINNGTASAAEIVSGALQDANRATLIGETTFGTGTVLNEFPLPDGSALLLAVQEWLTPKGRVIWHKGITPDITVALPTDVIPLMPEAERNMTAAELNASQDTQLLRAIQVLQKGNNTKSSASLPAYEANLGAPAMPAPALPPVTVPLSVNSGGRGLALEPTILFAKELDN